MAAAGSIRAARVGAGLTQEDVAVRAGCSVDYVRLLERGYTPRYSDVWPRIVAVLGGDVSALATRRREVGLSQEQLARYSGLDVASIAGFERGEEQPDRSAAERLAAALQGSVDQLFPENESSHPGKGGSTKTTGPDGHGQEYSPAR